MGHEVPSFRVPGGIRDANFDHRRKCSRVCSRRIDIEIDYVQHRSCRFPDSRLPQQLRQLRHDRLQSGARDINH